MDVYGNVQLRELEDFQHNLLQLSAVLEDYYKLVSTTLRVTAQSWRDSKFEEFECDFRRYKEEINSISEDYRRWANGYLQNTIDIITEFASTDSRP